MSGECTALKNPSGPGSSTTTIIIQWRITTSTTILDIVCEVDYPVRPPWIPWTVCHSNNLPWPPNWLPPSSDIEGIPSAGLLRTLQLSLRNVTSLGRRMTSSGSGRPNRLSHSSFPSGAVADWIKGRQSPYFYLPGNHIVCIRIQTSQTNSKQKTVTAVSIYKCLIKVFCIIKMHHFYSNHFHTVLTQTVAFLLVLRIVSYNLLIPYRLAYRNVPFRYMLSTASMYDLFMY